MPIQIIDNFDLNALKPIDNRLVVGPTPSFYHNKDDIPNKYIGLRVWELPGAELGSGVVNTTLAGLGYVYTGSASSPWVSENTTSIGGGASNILRIPYFNSPNSILDSDIYYDFASQNVGISAAADAGQSSPFNNIAKLKVNGNVVISGKYVGSAGGADGGINIFGITDINGSNIVFGTMDIQRLGGNSNIGWILTSDNISSASYKIPSSINVGSATQLQNSRLIYGNSFNGTANVTGNVVFGTQPAKATIVYNQNLTLNLNVPSISGSGTINRTFALLEQPIQTFTGAVIMGYAGAGQFDPPGLEVSGRAEIGGSLLTNTVVTNGSFTINHTDPTSGLGTYTKLKVTSGLGKYWVTFGSETGSTNFSPSIRSGNGSAANPSYTFRGDVTTGIYRPASGEIGFAVGGANKLNISSSQVKVNSSDGLLITTNVGSPLIVDGGSSGFSCITLKSFVSNSVVSTPSGLTASAQIGHTSATTTLTISNEIGKSIVFRTSQTNSAGGNVDLRLALNNGSGGAPPEFSANQAGGLFIYNGGWRNIHANSFVPQSDIRIKKDILEYTDSVLNDIMNIKPITYDLVYDDDDKRYMGFSAQNLFEINPLLVSGDTSDIYGELKDHRNILGLNTTGIIAMLTNAVKELNLKVKELENKK